MQKQRILITLYLTPQVYEPKISCATSSLVTIICNSNSTPRFTNACLEHAPVLFLEESLECSYFLSNSCDLIP